MKCPPKFQETSGKEDDLRSPYLDEEFEKARNNGVIPNTGRTSDLGGSWSAIRGDTGEATNLNLAHVQGYYNSNEFFKHFIKNLF